MMPETLPGLFILQAFQGQDWANGNVCMHYTIEWLICCLHPQPTVVQPCPTDSHTVSPSHVQLGFTDQPNCQAVSNGLYAPATQSAQVAYMHEFRDKHMETSVLQLKCNFFLHIAEHG